MISLPNPSPPFPPRVPLRARIPREVRTQERGGHAHPEPRRRVMITPPQRSDDLRPGRRAIRPQRVLERRVGVVRAAQQHERRLDLGVVVGVHELPRVKRHHRLDGVGDHRRAPHRAPRAERVPRDTELGAIDCDTGAGLKVREHPRGVHGGHRTGGSVGDAPQIRTRGDHPPRREVF